MHIRADTIKIRRNLWPANKETIAIAGKAAITDGLESINIGIIQDHQGTSSELSISAKAVMIDM
jgi:hypothetical protein